MSKKLVTTGSYEAVKGELGGLLLCGADGKSVVLREIRVGADSKEEDVPQLEFVCEVGGLKGKYSDEWEPIEATAVSSLVTLKGDRSMTFDKLSRALGLIGDAKLLDDGEDWMRLVADDHPRTLVPKGGWASHRFESLYLSVTVKQDSKDPERVGAVYFNLESPPVRKVGVKLDELKKRFGKPSF